MRAVLLAELMRGTEKTRQIPIVFVTAAGKELNYSFKGYEAGAVDVAAGELEVSYTASPDFANPLTDATDLSRNEHAVTLAPGAYHWRVAAIAPQQGQGPFSDTQAFTQRPIPESPQADAPQVDDRLLSFSWRAGESGEKYQIQHARE